MKVKCEYCGYTYEDTKDACPNCGAPNPNRKEDNDHDPKTIKELQKWYQDHNLPSYETTRFFIGKDYKQPKAFGIYHDSNTNEYVVYKNKANGERVERYRGRDEEYAVGELLEKLKDEILKQKVNNNNTTRTSYKFDWKTFLFVFISIFSLVAIIGVCSHYELEQMNQSNLETGYYNYDGNLYYDDHGSWYRYSNYDYLDDATSELIHSDKSGWDKEDDVPKALTGDKKDAYFLSSSWNSDYTDFGTDTPVEDSQVYKDDHKSLDDYINSETDKYQTDTDDDDNNFHSWGHDDYSWSSDDHWNSGTTDWNSDW